MFKKLRKNKKGFTLIEIIVVIVILAVLMAVAVPSVMKYIDEADNAKYMAQGRTIMTTAQAEMVKAYVGDKKIDETEIAALNNVETYTTDVTGLGNVTAVQVLKSGTVSEANGTITVASPGKLVADAAPTTTMQDFAAVYVVIDGKYIVAVPNGKIYVSKNAVAGLPVA